MLLHLNGPPGVGKSTLAKRYVRDNTGALNCDVDVLRTLIGGWDKDFIGAGALIRPAALAMIEAYLASGHDVVLPQLLVNPVELARFEAAPTAAGARFVERILMDSPEATVSRFAQRGYSGPLDPWHNQVRAIVEEEGGSDVLLRYHAGLKDLIRLRSETVVIDSVVPGLAGRQFDRILFLQSFGYAKDSIHALRVAGSMLTDDGFILLTRTNPIRYAIERSEENGTSLGEEYWSTDSFAYRHRNWDDAVTLTKRP